MEWESFLPFLATFFGVLAAFVLQWLVRRYNRRKDRQQFLQEIRKELESCSKLLIGEGHLLPIDMWESGKASGWIGLIRHEVKTQFAAIYFRIECHNYEAEKVRDVGILAETTKAEKPKADIEFKRGDQTIIIHTPWTNPELLWQALSVRLKKSEEALKNDIDNLLKQNIWN